MSILLAKSRFVGILPRSLVSLYFLLALAACGSGRTWQASALSTYHMRALVVNTNRPQEIYAGGAQGVVLVSVDAGEHWHRTPGALPPNITINALGLDAFGKKLYAVTTDGIWTSSNSGQRWRAIAATMLPADTYTAPTFDTAETNTLYIGSAHHGIFMSTDAGSSWKNIASRLPGAATIRGLTYDIYRQQLWAATTQGIYRTSTNGASWSLLDQGLPAHVAINSVILTTNTIIYAGTQQGIYSSQDNGAHWSARNETLANAQITSLLLDPHSTNSVYVGTQVGAFQSFDQGNTWSTIATGLPENVPVQALVVAGTNSDHFIVALDTIYTSTNTSGNSILNFLPILIFAGIFIALYYFSRRRRQRPSRKLTAKADVSADVVA